MTTRAVLLLAALLVAVSGWAEQSLAEIAKKEKERRKALESEKGEVITDRDLRTYRSEPPRASRTTAPAAGEATEEEEEPSEEAPEDPRRTESYWRDRLRPVDDRIRRIEQDLASPLYTSNVRGGPARQRLEQDLEQARRDRQAIVDEARRAGVPPGWLR